jgi:hypothetical protein
VENNPPRETRNHFISVLASESFLEKAYLLVLTVMLTGIVVPLVVKSVDASRERRAAITSAQSKLFDDLSETILTYETLALDVSWFGTSTTANVQMQKKAFERYNERTTELTAKWRILAARSRTLTSPIVANKINTMLSDVFMEQDTPMLSMWNRCNDTCDWGDQHRKNEMMTGKANALIAELAVDLGLAVLTLGHAGS